MITMQWKVFRTRMYSRALVRGETVHINKAQDLQEHNYQFVRGNGY